MAFDFPTSPLEGQIFQPSGGPIYVYRSGVWAIPTTPPVMSIGDTAPVSPVPGQLWWESDTGNSFVWFDDGTSKQWVQFNVGGARDRLVSVPEDMSAFFTSNAFVINDKPDGSGNNVFRVNELGNVVMGSLISSSAPAGGGNSILQLSKIGANYNGIQGLTAGSLRWLMQIGATDAESGSNAGSSFYLTRYSDAGAGLSSPFQISRQLGSISQAPTRASDNGLGNANVWHTLASDLVIDHAGPGATYGIHFANRNTNPTSVVHCLFGWVSGTAGSISSTSAGATAYATSSDIRMKGDIAPASDARALIDALEVIEYKPNPVLKKGERQRFEAVEGVEPATADPVYLGIPAQQAYGVYPPAVVPPDETMPSYNAKAALGDEGFMPWMIDYSKFVPMLIANLQEANARIDALEAKLAEVAA